MHWTLADFIVTTLVAAQLPLLKDIATPRLAEMPDEEGITSHLGQY
jgi:hypothetical protein